MTENSNDNNANQTLENESTKTQKTLSQIILESANATLGSNEGHAPAAVAPQIKATVTEPQPPKTDTIQATHEEATLEAKAQIDTAGDQPAAPETPTNTDMPTDTPLTEETTVLETITESGSTELSQPQVNLEPSESTLAAESATLQSIESSPIHASESVQNSTIVENTTVVEATKLAEETPETRSSVETTTSLAPVTPQENVAETAAPANPANENSLTTTETSDAAPMAPAHKEPSGFETLGLGKSLLKAIVQSGYDEPTEIQSKIIPHVLEGRDILAQSQTGSGKTAAFALPILTKIDLNKRKPQVLVLAPTRELAIQVAESFETYGAHIKKLNVLAIYGGQDYSSQFRQLKKGVQVIVGTPGRVIDHIKRETLDLSELDCLVLDEADEMLNMGFLEDVEFVLQHTPKQRQIALFSATLPSAIRNISKRYLNDPATITIKRKTMTADSIRQRAVFVSPREKIHVLSRFLEAETTDGVIIFTRTRDTTTSVAEKLNRIGYKVSALNGDMPQRTRERTIDMLKSKRIDIVVATDIAARGLDVTRISHVFNYDLPDGSESYIHRVGRTGRAGRDGEAIIFLTRSQRGRLKMIEKATKKSIEIVNPPTVAEINEGRVTRFKEKIVDVATKKDLSMFTKMLVNLSKRKEVPMETIAAALAEIAQNGRSFFEEEQPKSHRSRDGFERSREGQGRPDRGREFGPPESGMKRYRIEVGRRDGVKPGNIVGAVANEAGIKGSDIGPIKIFDSFSTIDLPESMPNTSFDTLQTTRVAGRMLKLKPDQGPRERRDRRDGKPGGKSKGFRGKRSGAPGGKKGFKAVRNKRKSSR